MTIGRRSQISLDNTPYYHCIARCVRRAFLCGEDSYSGQDFNHRRTWLVDRLKQQASIFGIDICAYAIMSNHYHVVLRVDRDRVRRWTDEEVIQRWTQLFRGPLLVQRLLAGDQLTEAQSKTITEIAGVWRARLYDISWFMRCLNERIARRANAEDSCTGRFWEGRFKSQALLDEAALLSCMAYVDLNPVRAGLASNVESSDFTSIRERLQAERSSKPSAPLTETSYPLLAFSGDRQERTETGCLPFTLRDYAALVEATGRCVRSDKRGAIPVSARSALDQLSLSDEAWLRLTLEIQASALQAVGAMARLRRYGAASGRRWIRGSGELARIYKAA
jgi:putative transposase